MKSRDRDEHTFTGNVRVSNPSFLSIIYAITIIGASLSEPHINAGTAMRAIYMYMVYVRMYVWYVRHPRAAS